MLSQAEISAQRAALKDQLAVAQGEVKIIQQTIRNLQSRCPHPNKKTYWFMGESGLHCETCGWES